MSRTRVHIGKLVASLVVAQSAGIIGALFTTPSIPTWYAALAKPSFNPPSWVFGPVWTLLYTMLGIALYLVWTRHLGGHNRAMWIRLFFVQLVLNVAWSVLFFGHHLIGVALVEILILLASIVGLIVVALLFDKRIAYILVPYLGWVGFAAVLNYTIWMLNR
jgi:benzodiazapine receptor